MRIIFLAASATALLAVATAALSVQAGRSPAVSGPALPQPVTAAPTLPAPDGQFEEAATLPSGPAEQPTAAPVIRVKSIRVEPERPPLTPPEPQPATAADNQERESAAIKQLSAALADSESRMAPAVPAQEARTNRIKRPVVVAKRSAHPKRKVKLASTERAAERAANADTPPAVAKPGPESLNPLGRLLTQGQL